MEHGLERAQRLRELAALSEDTGLVPSTHVVAHNHLLFQIQGISALFWLLWASRVSVAQTHMQTNTQIDMKYKLSKPERKAVESNTHTRDVNF